MNAQMNGPAYNAIPMGNLAQEARPMTELEEREERLSDAIAVLHKTVALFEAKIGRTLLPEPPCSDGVGKAEMPMRCDMAQGLASSEQAIRNVSRHLENLMGRCQL